MWGKGKESGDPFGCPRGGHPARSDLSLRHKAAVGAAPLRNGRGRAAGCSVGGLRVQDRAIPS